MSRVIDDDFSDPSKWTLVGAPVSATAEDALANLRLHPGLRKVLEAHSRGQGVVAKIGPVTLNGNT